MTDVVAALIWDNDRFLACQRPANKARALLWEFVGGKTEVGETLEEALIRECREELDIVVSPERIFMQVVHEYPDITVRLSLFNATISQGTPRMLEHNDIRWITAADIPTLEFCPADKDILAVLSHIHNHRQAELFALHDDSYKIFQAKLIPTIGAETILGVRMPILRKLSKTISTIAELGVLPHLYYEENCLHGLFINEQNDFNKVIEHLNSFLPYVDNWAVCDLLKPKAFSNNPPALLKHIESWLASDHPYTVRFGIGMLLKFYLDDNFDTKHLHLVAKVCSEHYYVKMMAAWYFATAMVKHYRSVYSVLQDKLLDPWVHNKTIQKACESYRLTQEQKQELRLLSIKRR